MKIYTILKIFVLLLFGFIVPVNAKSFAQSITLSKKNVNLKEIFREIKNQTNYNIIASSNVIDETSVVSVHVSDASVNKVLDEVLSSNGLTYSIEKNTILIKKKAIKTTNVNVQQEITGIVVDSNNEPLIGVSIKIKGEKTGVTSAENGRFSINIQPGEILQFSYIGFASQEIPFKNQTELQVVLLEDNTNMDEVVVVGYGTQKRASVVGAITTINPEKLQIGTTRSMSNNLAGQLAGVIGVQRSGEPGYDDSNFWIRGISTFGGNRNPLVLVDGIERSLNNIDPEEIESFSILKDASASAVYGVRGANGVILINTKRGKIGKPTVSLRVERGITEPVKLSKFVGAADYLEIMNNIREERGAEGLYTQERIDNIRNQTDPDLYPDGSNHKR